MCWYVFISLSLSTLYLGSCLCIILSYMSSTLSALYFSSSGACCWYPLYGPYIYRQPSLFLRSNVHPCYRPCHSGRRDIHRLGSWCWEHESQVCDTTFFELSLWVRSRPRWISRICCELTTQGYWTDQSGRWHPWYKMLLETSKSSMTLEIWTAIRTNTSEDE